MLAEVEGRRADQIANIFDEEQFDMVPARLLLEAVKAFVGQGCVEVAGPAGGELDDRHPFGPDALGIELGFDVAFDDPDGDFPFQRFDGVFEQGGLAGTGAADQVEGHRPDLVEMVAVGSSQGVVGGKKAGMDIDCFAVGMTRALGRVAMIVVMTVAVVVMVFGGAGAAADIAHIVTSFYWTDVGNRHIWARIRSLCRKDGRIKTGDWLLGIPFVDKSGDRRSFHLHLAENEIVAAFGNQQELAATRAAVRSLAGGAEILAAAGTGIAYRNHLDPQLGAAQKVVLGGQDIKAEAKRIDHHPGQRSDFHGDADDLRGPVFRGEAS
jgi:hypothetical protein